MPRAKVTKAKVVGVTTDVRKNGLPKFKTIFRTIHSTGIPETGVISGEEFDRIVSDYIEAGFRVVSAEAVQVDPTTSAVVVAVFLAQDHV